MALCSLRRESRDCRRWSRSGAADCSELAADGAVYGPLGKQLLDRQFVSVPSHQGSGEEDAPVARGLLQGEFATVPAALRFAATT